MKRNDEFINNDAGTPNCNEMCVCMCKCACNGIHQAHNFENNKTDTKWKQNKNTQTHSKTHK